MSVTSILFKELAEIHRLLPKPPSLPTCVECAGPMPHIRVGDRHAGCKSGAADAELQLTDSALVTFAVRELGLAITGRLRNRQQDAVRDLMVRVVSEGWAERKKAHAREKAKERRQKKKVEVKHRARPG